MHEIKIYGYISNVAEQENKEVSLLDVQGQLALAEGKDILCRINSNGGDVDEGFAIYYELRRYAKENNAKIKTFAESRLGSIATVIFLAGDERELTTDLQPFVHEASFTENFELTEEQKNTLRVINERIAKHYALHTDLTVDEALELMQNSTNIPTEIAKEMRFATSIEQVLRPVALRRFENLTTNINKMSNNKDENSVFAKKLEAFFNFLGKTEKPTVVNKVLYAAAATEIDFYELAEDELAEVGAKARINGQDAQGNYTMADGSVYTFDKGVLIEILAKQDDLDTEALKAENAELKAKLSEVMEKSTAKIDELIAENSKKDAVIGNYQRANSQAVMTETTTARSNNEVIVNEKELNISKAIKNLTIKN